MKTYTQEQLASRIVNIRSIENVMSKYAFLTYYKRFDEAVNNFWTQNEPTLTTNDKKIAGYSAVYREIVEKGEEDTRVDNEAMRKLFPELADKKDSEIWGVGTAVVHTISTPVIELSEDEKTAKAMFYSMGGGMSQPPDGPGKYQVYSRTRVPSEYPRIPEPYTTLEETFSY